MEDKRAKYKRSSFFLKLLDKHTMDITIDGIRINHTDKTITFDKSIIKPKFTIINGCKVISLFEKSLLPDTTDGNPLLSALKGEDGWTINHNKILNLLSEFVQETDLLAPFYDTIMSISTFSTLDFQLLHPLNQFIKKEVYIQEENIGFIDANEITTQAKIHDRHNFEFDEFDEYVLKMYEEQDNKFSFKGLPEKWMYSFGTETEWYSPEIASLKHANDINGKDVLILDDLWSLNKLSNSIEELNKIFVPKSVTVVRLFPLDE